MRKVLLAVVSLLLMTSWAEAQVFADFETDVNSFSILNWSTGVTALQRVPDPTGNSSGCLQVTYSGVAAGTSDPRGNIQRLGVPGTRAPILIYYVYLPADTPDSLAVQIFAQDRINWNHTTQTYFAVDIPKQTWFPIEFPMQEWDLRKTTFDPVNTADFGQFGIEIQGYALHGADLSWGGNILFDNVSWIGIKPTVIADFENDVNGYSILNWSTGLTSLTRVADPTGNSTGALQLSLDKTAGVSGHINKSGIAGTAAPELVYYVYLPANTPDDLGFIIFVQDNISWNHTTSQTYLAVDIPKQVWYPLHFPLKGWDLRKTTFDPVNTNPFGWFGLQVDIGSTNWTGNILVDNVSFLSDIVEPKWVAIDFETPAASLEKFFIPATGGPASVALSRITDPGDATNSVLKDSLDFTKGFKAAIERDTLLIYNATTQKYATKVTLDFYVPSAMPLGAEVTLMLGGPATNGDLLQVPSSKFFLDNGTGAQSIGTGKWNTISFVTDSLVTIGALDPLKYVSVYAEIYYPSSQTWKGNVYIDNLTFLGIDPFVGPVVSPFVAAAKHSTAEDGIVGATPAFDYVMLEWIDNLKGTETYNVYTSHQPITSVLTNVVKIATGIPHGQLMWAHRPWSSDGSEQTFYYAVTANDGATERPLNAQCKAGPFTIKTSKTLKVRYVNDFASSFVLDGNDTEFQPHKINEAVPEMAGEERATTWTPTSNDMNYRVTFVFDDNYLYISAVVKDDMVTPNLAQPTWRGDAVEFYLGFYDAKNLTALHPKGIANSTSTGDWRIGVTSVGQFGVGGSDGGTRSVPGGSAKTAVTSNGYTIEARLTLDSLATNGAFTTATGMWLPFRVDGNDYDSTKDGIGANNRGIILQTGGWGGAFSRLRLEQDWERPSTFGYMEIVDKTVDVSGNKELLPKEFALYNNYPNPFNPTSKIKYDLPRDVQVSLKVYDILGREVATLVDTKQSAGYYAIDFNATNLASGAYIYRITAGDFVQTKKMMVLK
jgi:hypothetical protein